MKKNKVQGLRIFLITVLGLISSGTKVSCGIIEDALSSGVATKLWSLHKSVFEENGFNEDYIHEVDEYFRQWAGIADGQEMRKYACTPDDGLALIIMLALNEIS